jgi:large subunit ribosomal protein L25
MEISVELTPRAAGTKPNSLRRSGHIPVNLYGHDGDKSILLTLDAKSVENLIKKARVNKTPVEVSIPELNWKGTTVVAEIQTHPWKNFPYHLSFLAVKA